jgi:hypothetical protein
MNTNGTESKFAALKWINRQTASLAVLGILFWVGAGAHWMAITRLGMTNNQLPVMDPANESRVQMIGYIDEHWWLVLPYAAVFAACLLWLQFRQAPRWFVMCVFGCLALPNLAYLWVCLRVGTEFIIRRT